MRLHGIGRLIPFGILQDDDRNVLVPFNGLGFYTNNLYMSRLIFKIWAAGGIVTLRTTGLVVLAVLLTGCASSRPASDVHVPEVVVRAEAGSLEQMLRDEIAHWHGTPHVWGGTTPQGADCSGFIHTMYQQLFAVNLPRTTSEQVREGAPIQRNDLRAGDLIFFRPSGRSNHVGIYLSDGYFAHISTSRGLMYSHIDERYWHRAYWTSRRVLRTSEFHTTSASIESDTPPTTGNPGRGGW